MPNIDKVFAREFKNMMNDRHSIMGTVNPYVYPIPKMPSLAQDGKVSQLRYVKGITEPFFEKLNKNEVYLLPKQTFYKRLANVDGSFIKNADGTYAKKNVVLKTGFEAIVSNINIGLRKEIEVDGVKRKYQMSSGYQYVDYVEGNGKRQYIYMIPETCVYELGLCALILTINKMRVYYKGCKLALQNGNYVYLYVIPYKYRENPGYRVVGVKPSPDFDIEVNQLLQYWLRGELIFDLNITALDEEVGGETNVGIQSLGGTIGYDDYVHVISKET